MVECVESLRSVWSTEPIPTKVKEEAHVAKVSPEVPSCPEPIVEEGQADVIIAFERLEALRYAHFLKKDGALIINDWRIDPMPVVTGATVYPQDLIEKMKAAGANVDAMDCLTLAREAGSEKAVNLVLLGRLSRHYDIPLEHWQAAIEVCVPKKFLEINQKAFLLGRNTKLDGEN